MKWTADAKRELEQVPAFVRDMAAKAVENEVLSRGSNEITAEDVRRSREKYISFAEGDEEKGNKKTRIAVVRCETVSEVCPGVACFKAFNNRKQNFKTYDDAEIIGYFTCGGCPGRRVSRLVDSLKKHGLDVVHLSSCMKLQGNYPPCPHYDEIRRNIENKGIRVVDGTHH